MNHIQIFMFLCRSVYSFFYALHFGLIIYPYFDYCIPVWGSCAEYLKNVIFIIQKKAVRCITKSHYLAHTDELFQEQRLLKIEDLFILKVGQHMYNTLNFPNFDPDLLNYFTSNTNIHDYSTRSSNIVLPLFRFERSKSSIFYVASMIWNSLDINIKGVVNLRINFFSLVD